MMNLDRFWNLIEQARQRCQGQTDCATFGTEDALAETLTELTPDEIVQFDQRFHEQILTAYHWDLWAALYIIGEGCGGADAFEHFRAELILYGREVFEAAVADADSLSAVTPLPWGHEGLVYVPAKVYEQKSGHPFPQDENVTAYPDHPAGEPWTEVDLPQRLPQLWNLYGDALAE